MALSALLITACGFQLEGTFNVPEGMERTYIQTQDEYSLFYRALRRDLLASGVQLVDSADSATAVFNIYFDNTAQRVLSVSARNVPTEYEVFYTLQYGLTSGENSLLDVQEITVTRDYTYDATLVLGKSAEEEIMREALVEDLVRIVLKQISVR